jgi:hypothetical protein
MSWTGSDEADGAEVGKIVDSEPAEMLIEGIYLSVGGEKTR